MRLPVLMRCGVLLAVFGLIAAMASPASAGKPEKIIVNDGPFPENVCGIDVMTTVTGHVMLHIQKFVIESTGEGSDDFWIGVLQFHLTITWTNENGVTLTNQISQTTQEGDLVDNGDGTWTYTYAVTGHPSKVRFGNKTLFMDRGRITFEQLIDFGDLDDFTDTVFFEPVVTSISGPHPEADSDFELFCEVFTDIMG